jgi:hypothetical protein
MSRAKVGLLGAATIWPFVYVFIFMAFWLFSFFSMQSGSGDLMTSAMMVIFPLHALTMLMTMGLWIFYIIHTLKNQALSENERVIWIILNTMGGMMAWSIYYWMHIRHSASERLAVSDLG